MNIISFLSIVTAVLYGVLIYHIRKTSHRDSLTRLSILVCSCLGFWSLCDAFFFVADTVNEAWFWHHLSSIGWCMYGGVTAYYFHTMSGHNKVFSTWWHKFFYWLVPVIFLVHNLFAKTTSLASVLEQSSSGLGWTFQTDLSSVWTLAYFAYLIIYLGGALVYLLVRGERKREKEDKYLANGLIVLNIVSIAACILTYEILPRINNYFPPMIASGCLIFLTGYWFILREYDLMHVESILNPISVFESSLDAMLITNLNLNILYENEEAKKLLHMETRKEVNFLEFLEEDGKRILSDFVNRKSDNLNSINLTMKDGTRLLCSASHAQTYNKRVSVVLLSLHDVTQLNQAQTRLDYLAHYDELTDLPNRRLLTQYLHEWEARYQEDHIDFTLYFLDLNNFKMVNDTFGHPTGDLVIRAVADAIKGVLNQDDVAARLSGDEFVVVHLLKEKSSKQQMEQILCECVSAVKIKELPDDFHINTSIGAATYSETNNIPLLMKLADDYMYENKKMNK